MFPLVNFARLAIDTRQKRDGLFGYLAPWVLFYILPNDNSLAGVFYVLPDASFPFIFCVARCSSRISACDAEINADANAGEQYGDDEGDDPLTSGSFFLSTFQAFLYSYLVMPTGSGCLTVLIKWCAEMRLLYPRANVYCRSRPIRGRQATSVRIGSPVQPITGRDFTVQNVLDCLFGYFFWQLASKRRLRAQARWMTAWISNERLYVFGGGSLNIQLPRVRPKHTDERGHGGYMVGDKRDIGILPI